MICVTDKPGTPEMHMVDAEDELMHLLELIQVKSERIKSELAQDPSTPGGSSKNKGLQAISEDEVSEVEQLRRERLLLLQRVAELESGSHGSQSSASRQHQTNSGNNGPKEGSHISAGTESESSISGIVHSVHIRTGQSDMSSPQVMSGPTMVTAAATAPPSNTTSQNNLTSSLRRTTSR